MRRIGTSNVSQAKMELPLRDCKVKPCVNEMEFARRSRTIKRFGSGRGKWCYGPTKEIAHCNPRVDEPIPKGCGGEPAVDCELDVCSDWGKGSTTCGGGQKGRTRKAKTEAKAGGASCG